MSKLDIFCIRAFEASIILMVLGMAYGVTSYILFSDGGSSDAIAVEYTMIELSAVVLFHAFLIGMVYSLYSIAKRL